VSHEDFADAALILIGHGTTQNKESSAPVYQHTAELRKRKLFARVREGFWKQSPRITEVLEEESATGPVAVPGLPRVFIAP
jgi:sirohydrochlorin cobaltochelatase